MRFANLSILYLIASSSVTWSHASYAQTIAQDTFKHILDDYNQSGFLSAQVDSNSYDETNDILTATNFTINFAFKWDESNNWLAMFPPTPIPLSTNEPQEPQKEDGAFLALNVTYKAPKISYKGLKDNSGSGYTFEHFQSDNAEITINLQSHEAQSNQTTHITMQGSQILSDGSFPFMGKFVADPAKPFTSFLAYLRPVLMKSKIGESITPVQKGIHKLSNGEVFQRETHGPITIRDIADGKIGSITQAYQTGETNNRAHFPDDLKPEELEAFPTKISYHIDEINYQNLDIGAIWSLFDPGMPKFDGYKEALNAGSVGPINTQGENGFELSIAAIDQKNIKVKQPETYLLRELEAALPQLKASNELDRETNRNLTKAYFALLSSISLERIEAGPIKALDLTQTKNNQEPREINLEKLLLTNLNADGMEEFSLNALSFKAKPNAQASLGKFAITNLKFPNHEDLTALFLKEEAGTAPPTPEEIAKAFPPQLEIGLEDLAFEDNKGSKITAKDIELAVKTAGLTIPAHLRIEADQLTLSRAMLTHPLAQSLMNQLNMNELTLNQSIEMNWDAQKETYSLDPLIIDLPQIAKLSGAIGFGGIKRAYLANPDRAAQAMATASILPSDLNLENQGGLSALINLAGLMSGLSSDQMQAIVPAQVQTMLAAYTTATFAKHVSAQISTFMQNPQSLQIALAPTSPIPMAQILGVLATGPQILPEILKIDVKVNDL